MNTTLDGQALFDENDLEIASESVQRRSLERNVPGLDGTLSIDLGPLARKVTQRGVLRAVSDIAIRARIDAINAFLDGQTHTLRTAHGQEYVNVRMDSFKHYDAEVAGLGLAVKYEIVYTQLRS